MARWSAYMDYDVLGNRTILTLLQTDIKRSYLHQFQKTAAK